MLIAGSSFKYQMVHCILKVELSCSFHGHMHAVVAVEAAGGKEIENQGIEGEGMRRKHYIPAASSVTKAGDDHGHGAPGRHGWMAIRRPLLAASPQGHQAPR